MNDSGQPNVQLLLQRLAVATLPQQKLDIVASLKTLTKTASFKEEIGRIALPQLVETMRNESSQEVVTEVVELLVKLVEVDSRSNHTRKDNSPYINTEFLLQDHIAVDKLLSLLQEKDKLFLRRNAVTLLRTLAENRPKMLGTTLLGIDAGMMRLVDVLTDQREEVRNELLLLLVCLTEHNTQVQDFCAFNDVWGSLLAIMKDEAMLGPIVQDCLQVIGNTLENNAMTCKLFSSEQCCQEVMTFLEIETLCDEIPPTAQHNEDLLRKSKFYQALRIFSSLVAKAETPVPAGGLSSGSDAAIDYMRAWQTVKTCQDQLGNTRLIKLLAALCFSYETRSLAASFHAKCFQLLGNIVRRHRVNQASLNRTKISARLGTAPVAIPSLLMSTILHPNNNIPSLELQSQPTQSPHRDAASMIELAVASPVHQAAVYLFGALWEDNDDHLIAIVGEAMMSAAHLLAMAEVSEGDSGAGSDNVLRTLIDELSTAGDELLTMCISEVDSRHAVRTDGTSSSAIVAEQVFTFWTACRLFEKLIRSNPTVKELALRIPVGNGGQFLLEYLLRLLSKLSASGTGLVLPVVQISALRLICEWTSGMPRVVTEIWQSSSNVFLLDLAARTVRQLDPSPLPSRYRDDPVVSRVYTELGGHIRGLACLYVGICMQCQCRDGTVKSAKAKRNSAAVVPSNAIKLLDFVKGPRLGLDMYFSSLETVLSSTAFSMTRSRGRHSRRADATWPSAKTPDDFSPEDEEVAAQTDATTVAQLPLLSRLYDSKFVKFFRTEAKSINETVVAIYTGSQSLGQGDDTASDSSALGEEAVEALAQQSGQLKKLVRSQQEEIRDLRKKEEQLEVVQQRYDALRQWVENEAQGARSSQSSSHSESLQKVVDTFGENDREVTRLKAMIDNLKQKVEEFRLEAEHQAVEASRALEENEELKRSRDHLILRISGSTTGTDAGDMDHEAAVRAYRDIAAENQRLVTDRDAVLAKLSETQQRLADTDAVHAISNGKSPVARSSVDERYSYLLLLLSKLKIENVALRSRLDKESQNHVGGVVADQLLQLP